MTTRQPAIARLPVAVWILTWALATPGKAQDWNAAVEPQPNASDYYVILHTPTQPGSSASMIGGPLTVVDSTGENSVRIGTECVNINEFQRAGEHDEDMARVDAQLQANTSATAANTATVDESLRISQGAEDQVQANSSQTAANTARIASTEEQVSQNTDLIAQNAQLAAETAAAVEAHSRLLAQHGEAISAHSRTLSEHDALLGVHEQRLDALEGRIDDVARDMAQGIALLSSLDFERPAPGKHVRLGLGGGTYEDESALSLGVTAAVGAFDCGIGMGAANGQTLGKGSIGWSFF
jgi:hypothetical protein